MSHSYVSNLMHCTFSTKGRYPFINSDLESRLWPSLGGIARENRMKALGRGDHFSNAFDLMALNTISVTYSESQPSSSLLRWEAFATKSVKRTT
jgi:hypothetical protein